MNRLFRDVPPVNNHRWGSSRLIRAPVLVVDLLTSLGVTPPPCPVTPAEYLPNQPYGAHADSNRIVNMQLYVICKSFYGCSASMLIIVILGWNASTVFKGRVSRGRPSRGFGFADVDGRGVGSVHASGRSEGGRTNEAYVHASSGGTEGR